MNLDTGACQYYDIYPLDCGDPYYDDEDFISDYMCCFCGGGDSDTNVSSLPCTDTDNGALNSEGHSCEDYTNGNANG